MGALAVLLLVQDQDGSLGLAGALTALYGLATAFGQPLLGRWMDRRGQPWVLLGSAVASALGYGLLAVAGIDPLWAAVTAVLVAGFATPPLESGLRALWPMVLGPGQVQAAYALDAAAQEILFTVGPLLTVLIATTVSPEAAVVATGVLGVAGTLVVVSSEPSRTWRGEAHTPHWAGAVRSSGLRVLLGTFVFVGLALGVLNVAALAYADHEGSGTLSGVFMAAMSFGALIGGLFHGAWRWTGSPQRRMPWLMLGLTLGYLPLLTAPGPWLMIPLAVVSGLFLAPAIACSFSMVDDVAPQGTVTEAFAWVVAAFGLGGAFGSAAAGLVGEHAGVRGAFGVAAASAAVGLVVLIGGRHTLSAGKIKISEITRTELSHNSTS
jgi:MFS family permease